MIHCSEQLPLNFRKCDMQGVKGLSAQQELCIKQRGVFMDIKERNKESKGIEKKKRKTIMKINYYNSERRTASMH